MWKIYEKKVMNIILYDDVLNLIAKLDVTSLKKCMAIFKIRFMNCPNLHGFNANILPFHTLNLYFFLHFML